MINNLKHPIICLILNLYIWTIIFIQGLISNFVSEQITLTYNSQWGYLDIFSQIVAWVLIGLCISWLISEKKINSTKDLTTELCIIIAMNIIVAFLASPFVALLSINFSLISFMHDMGYVLALLIGVEIFRITKYIRSK